MTMRTGGREEIAAPPTIDPTSVLSGGMRGGRDGPTHGALGPTTDPVGPLGLARTQWP